MLVIGVEAIRGKQRIQAKYGILATNIFFLRYLVDLSRRTPETNIQTNMFWWNS